jgi:hypothetical protein
MTAIPSIPYNDRSVSYNPVSSTTEFAVDFPVFGDGSDLEVLVDGVVTASGWSLTSPSGAIASLARPITDAKVTFSVGKSGVNITIKGKRQPRRTTQNAEGAPISARDVNLFFSDVVTTQQEHYRGIVGLEARVDAAEDDIDELQTDVADLQLELAIETTTRANADNLLDGRLDTLEGYLSPAPSDRAGKIAVWDVSGKISAQSASGALIAGGTLTGDILVPVSGVAVSKVLANHLPEFHPKDYGAPCNNVGDDAPGMQACIDAVIARGYGVIVIPELMRFNSTVSLASIGSTRMTMRGHGPDTSRIVNNHTGSAFQIGDAGAAKSESHLTLRDFALIAGAVTSTAAIKIHQKKHAMFRNMWINQFQQYFEIGEPANGDSCTFSYFDRLYCSGNGAGVTAINIRSAAALKFYGCNFNGSGQAGTVLFQVGGGAQNCDGLVVRDCSGADWGTHFRITDMGGANIEVEGGDYDRQVAASVYIQPGVGGAVRHCRFAASFGSGAWTGRAGTKGFQIEKGSGVVENIAIVGARVASCGDHGIVVGDGVKAVKVIGTDFWNCGYDGVPICSIGQADVLIMGCTDTYTDPVSALAPPGSWLPPTHGIEWLGASYANRASSTNIWATVTTAAETGTK